MKPTRTIFPVFPTFLLGLLGFVHFFSNDQQIVRAEQIETFAVGARTDPHGF